MRKISSSPYAPMVFGCLFIIIGFIDWYKNGVLNIGLFIFGIIPVFISVLLLAIGERTEYFVESSKSEKNFKKYKLAIEKYHEFIKDVYLCSNKKAIGNKIDYVCIHKVTQEMYSFSAKLVAHRGVSDVYCFAKQPSKIVTYTQLLRCLGHKQKRAYGDLNEANWKNYFAFMLLPAKYSGEILRKQLLSCDTDVVREAVFTVHNLVLKPPKERKDFLDEAYQNISLIKQNLKSLDMGGMFVPNSRFNNRAIKIIEGNNTDQCFCRLLIDEFGPSANKQAEKGFLLIQEDEKINDYSLRGIIECPVCHKQYLIIEEYTGWHIPTIIHCSEIPNIDSK